jgi:hypothetical protein
MTPDTLSLGRKLGSKSSIPDSIQAAICLGVLVVFAALWQLKIVSVSVLMGGTIAGAVALLVIAHRIPSLRTCITVYENGLETMVHGKSAVFAYDQLTSLVAKETDLVANLQYVRTTTRIEFFVDGRLTPYIYDFEFRRGSRKELLALLVMNKCSEAIERRLLAQLERDGAVRWRDNVSLTAEGLLLADPVSASRLIPYQEIGDWKIDFNDLKIWKANDALPCLVMNNAAPNFIPLFNLFQSLCTSIRNVDRDLEPAVS